MARQAIENGLTMQEVTERLNENFSELYTLAATIKSFNDIYPVGSIYMSVNSTSPATIFGGTWEQIKDTFLLSAGDTYTAGSTGGEAEHTLTVEEMPSHSHYLPSNIDYYSNAVLGGNSWYISAVLRGDASSYTRSSGDGGAHNNMPPYLTVYMWKRTALAQ